MSAKKNKKKEEKPTKYKRISIISGIIGVGVALVSVIFWVVSGSTQEECVFVEKFVGGTKMMMCEYENGNVVSDVLYKIHAIFMAFSVLGPIVGVVFGIISMIKKEKYGWNGLVLNLIFFYVVATIASIPTFWSAGDRFPYDMKTNERTLSD